jgi:hypothetical protein
MSKQHIQIRLSELGKPLLRIDDWEVFDFVDDFLTDRNFIYDFFTTESIDGKETFIMHFNDQPSYEALKEIVSTISQEAIEEIWLINNSNA